MVWELLVGALMLVLAATVVWDVVVIRRLRARVLRLRTENASFYVARAREILRAGKVGGK